MWWNGHLQQTAFLDGKDKVLEEFRYGRSNEKTLYRYVADKLVYLAHYYHNDSSEPGVAQLVERRFSYDRRGRLIQVRSLFTDLKRRMPKKEYDPAIDYYSYVSPYDTLINGRPSWQLSESNDSTIGNRDHWARNEQGQLVQHHLFYVTKMPNSSRLDTIYYSSQRFAHNSAGQLQLAWFDRMYLGRFYTPAGPDTIHYQYDSRSRLVRQVLRYTTDRRNKIEIDTTTLDSFERTTVADYRQLFFNDPTWSTLKHNRTDTIKYRYEPFDPRKHLPLQVSRDIGY